MDDAWWNAETKEDHQALFDEHIHDLGDVSHMLPGAVGADLRTSVLEVLPLIESHRIPSDRLPPSALGSSHDAPDRGERQAHARVLAVARGQGDR